MHENISIGTFGLVHNKQMFIISGFIISDPDCSVFFFNLVNYPTGVSQVIFVWGKGVHRRNDDLPLDKPILRRCENIEWSR